MDDIRYRNLTIIEISLTFVPVLPVMTTDLSSLNALLLACLDKYALYFVLLVEINGKILDVTNAPA